MIAALPLCLSLVLSVLPSRVAPVQDIVLAAGGTSEYRIVIAPDAPPATRHAAEELRRFVREMSDADLEVVTTDEPCCTKEVVLGANARLQELGVSIDVAALGLEGYTLRTAGEHLVIVGGDPRGTLYGVYGLLEDHLGCRWFTPEVSHIPRRAQITLPPLDETVSPVLEYREPFTFECFDGDWCARNRMNSSNGRLEAKHGGRVTFVPGYFVHTFATLVPPARHYAEHPEYFSLVGGRRLDGYAQLCCTNEDVIRLCIEGVRSALRTHPEAFVISVSQNDTFKQCECQTCQALATAEGSQMAPVLALVNRVASAIEDEFPDRAIETLAYQWTRHPPKTLRPRPNVIVRLCSIECCFSHPLATCNSAANRAFVADLEGWARVCDRLWIWDYATDFSHYLLPFPNQRVRDDNIRLFVRNHVRGIFEQDTYDTPGSELAGLGGYLTAKLLWDPDANADFLTREYLEAVYGPAAPPIQRYLDLLHDHVEQKNIHVSIWAPPTSPHLDDALLIDANRLWGDAERLAAEDGNLSKRVRTARLSLDYAIAERARSIPTMPDTKPHPLRLLARDRLPSYLSALSESGMTRLHEGRPLDHDAYRKQLTMDLDIEGNVLPR